MSEDEDERPYDPAADYRRQETMLRLTTGCCHLCLRSVPEVEFPYERYGRDETTAPICVECCEMMGADPNDEAHEMEREANRRK